MSLALLGQQLRHHLGELRLPVHGHEVSRRVRDDDRVDLAAGEAAMVREVHQVERDARAVTFRDRRHQMEVRSIGASGEADGAERHAVSRCDVEGRLPVEPQPVRLQPYAQRSTCHGRAGDVGQGRHRHDRFL